MKFKKRAAIILAILFLITTFSNIIACDDRTSANSTSTNSTVSTTNSSDETEDSLIPTSVNLASSKNPSMYGDTLVFTATVKPESGKGIPTGTVQFTIDGVNFGDAITLKEGKAVNDTISTLSIDPERDHTNHSIRAFYSGDANFANSFGGLLQTVNPLPPTTTPNPLTQGNRISGVWGSSASDVFAVGQHGTILHYDGSQWSAMTSNTTNDLQDVWGSSSFDVYAVGWEGTILHYDGSNWSNVSVGNNNSFNGVWGSSASDVFVVGRSLLNRSSSGMYQTGSIILHYDCSTWSSETKSEPFNGLYSIWGTSASDVFAVGQTYRANNILHYDGKTWNYSGTFEFALQGLWGTSSSDVFAVGSNLKPGSYEGGIFHYDGSTWSQIRIVNNYLKKIWGSSSSDIFVIGDNGFIMHYDGNTWSEMSNGYNYSLSDIWGSSSKDVFAVGHFGSIFHYDGSTWSTMLHW